MSHKPKYFDAFFYSFMIGAGESFFSAYALYLGFSEIQSGIVVTIPILIGGLIQFFSPWGINKIKSFEKWTMGGVAIHAILFLLFLGLDQTLSGNFLLFFALVSCYWLVNMSVTSSWNAWISSILEHKSIRSFFAMRSAVVAVGTLTGLCFSGALLQYYPKDNPIGVFKVIFFTCFLMRIGSLISLKKHDNVEFSEIEHRGILHDIRVFKEKYPFAFKFIIFTCLFKIGVYFSASFFTPYMLKQLHFSYIQYVAIIACAFSARAVLNQALRKFFDKLDVNKLYLVASIGICIIPFLWTQTARFEFLISMEFITGLLWGAFELAFFITSFEEIPTKDQSRFMTIFNLFHTIAIGIGSILGLSYFYFKGAHIEVYLSIFLISSCMRATSLLFFPRKKIMNGENVYLMTYVRMLAVRPNLGLISRPIWQLKRKPKTKK